MPALSGGMAVIMKDIIVIGAGGVGKETAYLIEQINSYKPTWNMLGFLDDNIKLHNKKINGYKVLGEINHIEDFDNVYTVCAIANYEIKRQIINRISKAKAKFANIIHPSVHISSTNILGEGIIIYPSVIMTTNIYIGNHVILSPGCGIGHETVIGDYCSVLWNVSISGNVKVGEGCLLGTGSSIIQNITIGSESVVGAGTLVLKNLPRGCTSVGVPAKVIKFNNLMAK